MCILGKNALLGESYTKMMVDFHKDFLMQIAAKMQRFEFKNEKMINWQNWNWEILSSLGFKLLPSTIQNMSNGNRIFHTGSQLVWPFLKGKDSNELVICTVRHPCGTSVSRGIICVMEKICAIPLFTGETSKGLSFMCAVFEAWVFSRSNGNISYSHWFSLEGKKRITHILHTNQTELLYCNIQ